MNRTSGHIERLVRQGPLHRWIKIDIPDRLSERKIRDWTIRTANRRTGTSAKKLENVCNSIIHDFMCSMHLQKFILSVCCPMVQINYTFYKLHSENSHALILIYIAKWTSHRYGRLVEFNYLRSDKCPFMTLNYISSPFPLMECYVLT